MDLLQQQRHRGDLLGLEPDQKDQTIAFTVEVLVTAGR
jgi:hypothetical protein